MSKVFFETVAVKEVDTSTNDLFNAWLEALVSRKEESLFLTQIQNKIDLKLAEIYSLNEADAKLIDCSEGPDNDIDPSIIARSELVKL